MKITLYLLFSMSLFIFCCQETKISNRAEKHVLSFHQIPRFWDEGIPLGNGSIGAMIWKKNEKLRLGLDRSDLWDLRPMENFDIKNHNYNWVIEHWKANRYDIVQKHLDSPYGQQAGPTKIPGAALEFEIESFGTIDSISLHPDQGICKILWKNGIYLETFVHASEDKGWFRLTGLGDKKIEPMLIPPEYDKQNKETSVVEGQSLERLNYPKGSISKKNNSIIYEQEGWNGFQYFCEVAYNQENGILTGYWTLKQGKPNRTEMTISNIQEQYNQELKEHKNWWKTYWSQSSIHLPDSALEKQWYLELYKFGSAARSNTPPISLQAVWTADNGKLPPWKGDFHHDLNTQLSYWPAYSANHLDLEEGFLSWLWSHKEKFKEYTKDYYQTDGLNVPGVTTLAGEPMGGWIQYSLGPTVSAWLSHHFYLHWQFSKDRNFLEKKAYPWLKESAEFIRNISLRGEDKLKKLPLSSSPEFNDNSKNAWFSQTTNFDLALIRWLLEKTAELADELGYHKEKDIWLNELSQWPQLAIDSVSGLLVAPNHPLESSHRHFSHLMAIHPLSILNWDDLQEKEIIKKTISHLDKTGSDWWTGYSWAWLGNIKARMKDGEGAYQALKIFSEAFCSPNSFHLNGDQSGKGYSKFTYRPFTLEGNFAFASGIQEMLIQSHEKAIKIFPAVPKAWNNISFQSLRTQGGFLISAEMINGETNKIIIESEIGGKGIIKSPFKTKKIKINGEKKDNQDLIEFTVLKGEKIILSPL